MRKCVVCNQEKELNKFRKRSVWFSHTCKSCYAAKYRTGKPNTGRYKKGNIPLSPFKKGHIPWIKGKTYGEKKEKIKKERVREKISVSPNSVKRSEWALKVKIRDEFKCQKCGSKKNLHSHHIIKWKDDKEKRFDLLNGITLCCACHCKEERFLEAQNGLLPTRLRNKGIICQHQVTQSMKPLQA